MSSVLSLPPFFSSHPSQSFPLPFYFLLPTSSSTQPNPTPLPSLPYSCIQPSKHTLSSSYTVQQQDQIGQLLYWHHYFLISVLLVSLCLFIIHNHTHNTHSSLPFCLCSFFIHLFYVPVQFYHSSLPRGLALDG